MLKIKQFTFNAFQENTVIVYDQKTNQAILFDPGNNNDREDQFLSRWITEMNLSIVRLINTHCHIDHILGNKYVVDMYELELEAHQKELPMLSAGEGVSKMYGIAYNSSPQIARFLEHGDSVEIGDTYLEVRLVPGHSPGSLCFYNEREKFVIAGDTLFQGSIGRTDLPGGNHDLLLESIRKQLFTLPDAVTVYPGHGSTTTIGFERRMNPFF